MHLRSIRSLKDGGKVKFDKYMKDFSYVKDSCNMQILPDIPLSEIDKIFSKEEEYDYLVASRRHNKKESKKLLIQIRTLKYAIDQGHT